MLEHEQARRGGIINSTPPGTRPQGSKIHSTPPGTSPCMYNHMYINNTSLSHDKERRNANSYSTAAKALVKNKVNQLDHFIHLT